MREESHGAHEKFSLFSYEQIDMYIKDLKHTSVMHCGVGSGWRVGLGLGGINSGLGRCRSAVEGVPNVVIKSGTAGRVL